MGVNSILLPTDFSPTSEAALHYASKMALTLGARLYQMHVPGRTGEHFEANFPHGQFEAAARRVARAIHVAHTARAEQGEDLVGSDLATWGEWHSRVIRTTRII